MTITLSKFMDTVWSYLGLRLKTRRARPTAAAVITADKTTSGDANLMHDAIVENFGFDILV